MVQTEIDQNNCPIHHCPSYACPKDCLNLPLPEVREKLQEADSMAERWKELDEQRSSDKSIDDEDVEELQRQEVELRKPWQARLQKLIIDPKQLPSRQDVLDAFPFENMHHNPILNKAWDKFCHKGDRLVCELLTQEYVQALAGLLRNEIRRLQEKFPDKLTRPMRILEAGAGDGKLSSFLEIYLKQLGVNVEFLPVDNAEWEGGSPRDKYTIKTAPVKLGKNVIPMDYQYALQQFSPDIVISSWMPPRVDFTQDFRNCETVDAYILIGPPTECGELDKTWGYSLDSLEEMVAFMREAYKQVGFTDGQLYTLARRIFDLETSHRNKKIGEFEMEKAPEAVLSLQISGSRTLDGDETSTTELFRRSN